MGCNFSGKTIEIGWIRSPELWWWSVSLHPYLFTKEGEKFVYRAMYPQCTHNVHTMYDCRDYLYHKLRVIYCNYRSCLGLNFPLNLFSGPLSICHSVIYSWTVYSNMFCTNSFIISIFIISTLYDIFINNLQCVLFIYMS